MRGNDFCLACIQELMDSYSRLKVLKNDRLKENSTHCEIFGIIHAKSQKEYMCRFDRSPETPSSLYEIFPV
jgi:hypothetical protein